MFRGDDSIRFATTLPDAAVAEKVEEALAPLGKVRIDKRGAIEVDPSSRLATLLTDVTIEGALKKRANGYELALDYNCKPSVVNWLIVVFGTAMLLFGWVAIFVPMSAKKKVGKAVRHALDDLEDAVAVAPGK